jgi:transposase InsO family protein
VLRRSVESAEYAAGDHRDILQAAAIIQSMSRKGNCCDNAPMKRFFGTLKTGLIHHCEYPDRDTRSVTCSLYQRYYNRQRIHSAIGHITPQRQGEIRVTRCPPFPGEGHSAVHP